MQNEIKLDNILQIFDDMDIQIACICETWFDSRTGTFTAKINEAGFDIVHAYREGKRGGGTAIIYQKSLRIKPCEASSSKYLSFEFSSILLKYAQQTNILLACVYRKQEQPFKLFLEELELFIDIIFNKADILIIVGDFNVWIDINSNKNAKTLISLMNAFGLNQLINVPTHNAGHTLDHVYVNKKQIDIKVEVLEDKLNVSTDHNPILMQLPSLGKIDNEIITYRKIKNIDIEKFKEEFEGIVEKLDFVNNDFDYNFKTFITSSRELTDKNMLL